MSLETVNLPDTDDADKARQAEWLRQHREWLDEQQARRDAGWPEALVKASVDPFDYAASVRGLGVVRFREAVDLGGGWVRLQDLFAPDEDPVNARLPYPFGRGVDVRVKDVAWAADAPYGS